MKRLILTLLLIITAFHLLVSQNEIDSLKSLLTQQSGDTNKLKTLEEISRLYSYNDLNRSLEYAEQTLKLAKQLEDIEWVAKANYRVGATHRAIGNYELATENLSAAKQIYVNRADYEGLQKVYYELASVQKRAGSLDTALSYYQKIQEWDSKVNDHSITAKSYNSLGSLYNTFGEFDKARTSYLQGMKLAKKYQIISTEAYSNFNIGTMYMQREEFENGRSFLQEASKLFDSIGRTNYVAEVEMYLAVIESETGNYSIAEPKLLEAKKYFEKAGNKRMLIECLQHLGINHKFKKEYENAEIVLKTAIKIAEEINISDRKVAILLNLADVYFQDQQYREVLATIEQGVKLNNENRRTLNLQKDLYELKYKAQDKIGDYQAALAAFKEYKVLEDSLENRTDDERFAQLEVEYEVEKKEQEIETQKLLVRNEKKFKDLLYAGIAILIVLIVVVAISYFNKRKANRLLAAKNQLISEQAEKLKELDNTKTKFFNNVAHELRTPLTLMAGHMESMLNDRFGGLNENQRKSVLVAKRNSNRLMDLVSEILDLGKLESGKMELKEKAVGLYPFLDRIFFTFESLAYQFNIQLQFDYELDKSLSMLLDEFKMEKALNNLIHNAIKFTPRGGKIQLRAFEEEGFIHIQVKDNGKGIAQGEQNRVFERYFQTEDKNAPAQGGTGIGLALVKEFVDLHSGKVKLESEEGKGSIFTIQLPVSRITEPIEFIEVQNEKEEDFPLYPILEKKDKTILVVDDHKEMQQYLKGIIGKYARVMIANDGVEALELLEKNSIDLITVDLMMPNMDGVSLLKQLKEKPEYTGLPSIMLTARAAEEDKLNALQIGVSDYIIKPFSQLELVARIANLLENKSVRETEQQSNDESEKESVDNQLIEKLRSFVNANLDSSELSVSLLAQEIGLSEKQLTRNVKSATGLTPLKFIREIKLLYAQEQLKSNNFHTVAEVSYAIGIDNPSHFAKLFKERFGKSPSEYIA